MRRSDRLFDLISLIRDGRLHRASDLAAKLEVSLRTVYRDMATLMASGLPIEGERGVGYALRVPIAMAPVSLSAEEAAALQLAVALLRGGADAVLHATLDSLTRKIAQAGGVAPMRPEAIYVHGSNYLRNGMAHLAGIRRAIERREKLAICYAGPDVPQVERVFRPLQIEFWGQVWTCTGWCELRQDFRVLRLDRIVWAKPTCERFAPEAGRDLRDYLALLAAKNG